jgi:hypothetical protein
MKFSSVVLLPAVISAAVLDTRQAQPKAASGYKFETKVLAAKLRQNSKRTLTRVGPLSLTPGVSFIPATLRMTVF